MGRLVVSGANGFLGSEIIRNAVESGIKVVAVTSRTQEMEDTFKDACHAVETGKFLDGEYKLTNGDVFINCLFPTNADGYRMADGLEKVFRMTTAAKESGAGAFINISSQSVYPSQRTQPAEEDDTLCLETPYAVGKYSSEVFCDQVFNGMPHSSIRLASLIGVGFDQRIINRMAEQALRGNELKVIGGRQRYGFLDVRDAASGIVKMATGNLENWKKVYNLGSIESYTLVDVAETVVSEIGKRGITASYAVKEGTDTRNSSINAKRFMKDFAWEPVLSLALTTGDIIDSKMGKDL